MADERPKNRETENEDLKSTEPGPPRSANEPDGSQDSARQSPTATDPSSGEARNTPDPKTTTPQGRPGP